MTAIHRSDGAPGRPAPEGRLPALRQIGVVLHPTRDLREPLAQIGRWARGHGASVVVPTAGVRRPLPPGVHAVPEASLARAGGILLALGGDGTMLHALAMSAIHGLPVLGIKLGHVSFLAQVDASDLGAALDALAARRFAIEERMLLTVRHGSAAELVVNDVVLRRAADAPLADIAVWVGGEEVARHRGDGLIVATPTGSTGYSLAAGGPLVSPTLAVTVVTPLAPQAASSPPMVLPAGEPIELRLGNASTALPVVIDGRARSVARAPAVVRVARSELRCRLIRISRH